jgi:hypothetical protein
VAQHANDPNAAEFFARNLFFQASKSAMRWSWVLVGLPVLLALASRRRRPQQG